MVRKKGLWLANCPQQQNYRQIPDCYRVMGKSLQFCCHIMVQYFKLGSWDRLIILLILFGIMQAPFLLFGDEIQVPELLWITLGKRLADGWRLYAHIADDTGPMAALVYAGLAKLGLANFHTLRYAGSALILVQAFWLNQMARRYQLMNDRNFLVAFFYLIFCHLGPDSVTLSPVSMAITFIIAVYSRLFKMIKVGATSDDAIVLGLALGCAVLCYQPSIIFLIPCYASALFFSGLRINQYLIILVAMLLPVAGVYTFFHVGGGEQDFWRCFMAHFRVGFLISWTGWDLVAGLSGILILVSLAGWVAANRSSRVNFQQIGLSVFFFGLVAAALEIFPGTTQSTYLLLFLVPHAAVFAALFMQFSRSVLVQEIYSLLLIIIFMGGFYGMANPSFGKQILGHSLFVEEPPKGFVANFKNKPILLLSNDFRYYKYNPPATRFFKFYLSDLGKNDSQTIEGLMYWYHCLAENAPAVIYDPEGFVPPLAVRIPEFGKCYRASFYPHLYESLPGRRFGKQAR